MLNNLPSLLLLVLKNAHDFAEVNLRNSECSSLPWDRSASAVQASYPPFITGLWFGVLYRALCSGTRMLWGWGKRVRAAAASVAWNRCSPSLPDQELFLWALELGWEWGIGDGVWGGGLRSLRLLTLPWQPRFTSVCLKGEGAACLPSGTPLPWVSLTEKKTYVSGELLPVSAVRTWIQ